MQAKGSDPETGSAGAKADGKPAARRPGRPPSSKPNGVNRRTILRRAYKLATTVSLQDISIMLVARNLNVTPALIHYYVGSRDWLTSGVMNLFYKDIVKAWPAPTRDWEADIKTAATVIYDHFVRYGGVANYAVANSRFRIFQLTAYGDRDYGVEMLDRFSGVVRSAGRSADRSGIYAHLILEFIINTAHATVRHLYPDSHTEFLRERISGLDPEKYPHILFLHRAPVQLESRLAFQEGIRLFLLGLKQEERMAAKPT